MWGRDDETKKIWGWRNQCGYLLEEDQSTPSSYCSAQQLPDGDPGPGLGVAVPQAQRGCPARAMPGVFPGAGWTWPADCAGGSCRLAEVITPPVRPYLQVKQRVCV